MGNKRRRHVTTKLKGSGIMVSDFVDERHGYLQLTDKEFEEASKDDITIPKRARETLEIGGGREGYWDSEKFMFQMSNAVKIADIKYPKKENWSII